MAQLFPNTILSITGSDGTGGSGIQADIKTCDALGTFALSVITAVTVQDTRGIQSTHAMPTEVIESQIVSLLHDTPPRAIKVGMICDSETVNMVANHIVKVGHVILDAAFVSSRGERIATPEVISEVCLKIMPISDIVIMKLPDVQLLIGKEDKDALQNIKTAAQLLLKRYDMKAIIVQGVKNERGMQHDFLLDENGYNTFFTLPDYTGCNTHGLASTLSASIAAYIAKGYTTTKSVEHAYRYLQTLTVYSISSALGHKTSIIGHQHTRQQSLYNDLMQLIVNNSHRQHDVQFYADKLNITPRYLSQVTMGISHQTPKQLISDILMGEAERLLTTTTLSIQEVAYRLGYSSQAQFTKIFKRIKGNTPSSKRHN